MPAKKGYNEKSFSKKNRTKIKYGCDEVEKYLDKAIDKVKNELLPKIDALDQRDKEQFSIATNHIKKYDSIVEAQDSLKKNQIIIKAGERHLEDQLEKLHEKIDKHIFEETGEFVEIHMKLNAVVTQSAAIQRTLDNVSANGNRGLSASLADVYGKLKDLETITESARARSAFWLAAQKFVDTNIFLKPFKSKIGAILYIIFLVIIINIILSSFGVQFEAVKIIHFLLNLLKNPGQA